MGCLLFVPSTVLGAGVIKRRETDLVLGLLIVFHRDACPETVEEESVSVGRRTQDSTTARTGCGFT